MRVRILLCIRSCHSALNLTHAFIGTKRSGGESYVADSQPQKTKFLVDSLVVYTAYEEVVQKPELDRLRNRCVYVYVWGDNEVISLSLSLSLSLPPSPFPLPPSLSLGPVEILTYIYITYIYTYIHTYTHAYIHTYIHTYIHIYSGLERVEGLKKDISFIQNKYGLTPPAPSLAGRLLPRMLTYADVC